MLHESYISGALILLFFVKKRTKGEILERIWAKTPYNTATIFKKCNVFYARYIVFILLFFVKKKNKRWDFRENLSKNIFIIRQHLTKKVTFFNLCWLKVSFQTEIKKICKIQQRRFFWKCNVFLGRYIAVSKISPFVLFFDKNSKMKTIYLA